MNEQSKLQSILPLYFPFRFFFRGYIHTATEIAEDHICGERYHDHVTYKIRVPLGEIEQVAIVLRRVDSRTSFEQRVIDAFWTKFEGNRAYFEEVRYLLSLKFDLFDLIAEGKAIDATRIPQSTPIF